MSPALRKRLGMLMLRCCGWVAVRGLRLAGATTLTVETPEYAREREEFAQRFRAACSRALEGLRALDQQRQRLCDCPRCVQARADAALPSRWN